MGTNKLADRRENQRYYVKNHVFAVVRSKDHQLDQIDKMSKGEIAFAVIKSNPPRMGEITEISRNGLSFTYIENETDLSEFKEMDILFADEDFHLSRLPFKPVKDSAIHEEQHFHPLTMKQQTVKFNKLSFVQQTKLEHMIKNFTIGEVPRNNRQASAGW